MNDDSPMGSNRDPFCDAHAPRTEKDCYARSDSDDSELENSDSSDAPESNQRVVMIYDDDGNAIPMPMGNFYHDSVRPGDLGIQADTDFKQFDRTKGNASAPTVKYDGNKKSIQGRLDSEAPVSGQKGQEIELPFISGVTEEKRQENAAEDRFKNQFMRIEAPAALLKDVSKVKRDVDHDKPKKRGSVISGLQRAVSSVNLGVGERNRESILHHDKSSHSREDQASVKGNTVGGNKKKSSPSNPANSEKQISDHMRTKHGFPDDFRRDHLQRVRDTKAERNDVRQGLAAVGRRMSIRKQKNASQPASGKDQNVDGNGVIRSSSTLRPSSAGPSANKMSSRVGLSQVGRLLSINRKKAGEESNDTDQGRIYGSVPTNDNCSDRPNNISDRERDETKKTENGSRMGLSRMGRMFSMTRTKPASISTDLHTVIGPKPEVSPISSSSVSSAEGHSAQDRVQGSSFIASSSRQEGARMSLRAAGRILSFSRKSKNLPRNHEGVVPKKSSVNREDVSEEQGIQLERPHCVPPRVMDSSVHSNSDSSERKSSETNKFFLAQISSPSIRGSAVMGQLSHIRVPLLALAEYSGPVSRTKWYIDGFTLPHNAVRKECIDLYEILMSMASSGTHEGGWDEDISGRDLDLFEEWWYVASLFFKCYFEMERDVLFPWVNRAGASDWEVQIALKKMRSMKEKLEELLKKVDGVWKERHVVCNGDLYALVYQAVDEFVPRLVNYFADQEVLLPAIVRGYFRLEDRLIMDRDMIAKFMGGEITRQNRELAHHNMILLVRWIKNPRQLRAWIGKNLNSKAREQYGRWYELFEQHHYHIVKLFRSRQGSSRK